MKTFIVVLFFLIANMGLCQMNVSLINIDSLLNSNNNNIFDGLFPNKVNSSIAITKSFERRDLFGKSFQLIRFYDSNKKLVKEKVVYGRNSSKNFQVFFGDFSSIKIGVLYYCFGDGTDEKVEEGIPYVSPLLTSLLVEDKNSSMSFLISYNYKDTIFKAFQTSKLSSFNIIGLNKKFYPEFMISQCRKDSKYSLFYFDNLEHPVKSNMDLTELLKKPLEDNFKINSKSVFKKNSSLDRLAMYDWNGFLFCEK